MYETNQSCYSSRSLVSANAIAAPSAAKKAESAMMSACEKDYASNLKGKKASEVSAWVEKEEHGPNGAKFKKSKCYKAHEKWEKATHQEEPGEEHEY